jgi:hypothetical protein
MKQILILALLLIFTAPFLRVLSLSMSIRGF